MLQFPQELYDMVHSQIHTFCVLSPEVMARFFAVDRAKFVPPSQLAFAYADVRIPLGAHDVMPTPKEEGLMLERLALKKTDRVLEIGTGSGFFAALLSGLVNSVHSVDILFDRVEAARVRLEHLGCSNVTLEVGDGSKNWKPNEHYDVIVITGALAQKPEQYLSRLQIGDRLFAVYGTQPKLQTAWLWQRDTHGQLRSESLYETAWPYLQHAAPVQTFVL